MANAKKVKKAKKVISKKKAVRPKTKKSAAKKPKTLKTAKRKIKKVSVKRSEPSLEKVGEVTHYFPHVNAAAVKVLKNSIKVGDKIYIKGHTSDFKEKVDSIQLDHSPIQEGKKGQEIGLQVKSRVRIGDSVYKV